MSRKPRISAHNVILISLALGGLSGVIAQLALGADNKGLKAFVDNVADPIGGAFLAMIFMIVVPLLFSALVLGVNELGDVARVGRIGVRALVMTVVLSSIAVLLALAAVNIFQPGAGIDEASRARMTNYDKEAAASKGSVSEEKIPDPPVLGTIPKNPLLEATRALSGGLLPFMFFAVVFGLAVAMSDAEKVLPLVRFMEGLFEASQKVIELAMKLAPIGVFFLVFKTGALMGWEAFLALGRYALLVLAVLAIQQYGVYSLALVLVAKMNPLTFFKAIRRVQLTAFATSSSNATLPVALKSAEEDLGLPREISTFVLTVGATANQNGTALFEGITILFLAQFMGVPLDWGQQATVLGLAIVAGIGTAGVPGGAWPMIGSILGRFGIAPDTIGLVLGIDRILDMSRTVLNVTGDIVIAACVARWEGNPIEIPEDARG
jgi:DAACS family dicarboxylate/amino acid:cation (Na+ or H+) symporter